MSIARCRKSGTVGRSDFCSNKFASEMQKWDRKCQSGLMTDGLFMVIRVRKALVTRIVSFGVPYQLHYALYTCYDRFGLVAYLGR